MRDHCGGGSLGEYDAPGAVWDELLIGFEFDGCDFEEEVNRKSANGDQNGRNIDRLRECHQKQADYRRLDIFIRMPQHTL